MLDGKRGAWVGAGHHAEEHRDIGNRASHGAFYTQSMEKQFTAEARHAAVGSAKTKREIQGRLTHLEFPNRALRDILRGRPHGLIADINSIDFDPGRAPEVPGKGNRRETVL